MKYGKLVIYGPYGRMSYKVKIVLNLFGFCRIEALSFTQLAGDNRYLNAGERAWVPENAIRKLDVDEST